MTESTEFTKLRQKASAIVDAEFKVVHNEALKSLYGARGNLNGFYPALDQLMGKLSDYHSQQIGKFAWDAYLFGYKKGLREVGVISVKNQASPQLPVENSIRDVVKRVVGKSRDTLGAVGKKIKQAIDKVIPKRSQSKPLSPADLKKARDVTQETIEKLKRLQKHSLQDEITKEAANGKLDAYRDNNIKVVTAVIDTVHDSRRCKACAELDGLTLPLDRAKSLIPRHPNCRCMWKLAPGQKGLSKAVQQEAQAEQQRVYSIRDRLKNGKAIPVHNEHHHLSIFNELEADTTPRIAPESPIYGVFCVDNPSIGSYNLLLQPAPLTANGGKTRVQVISDVPITNQILPAGTLLRVTYHDPRTKKTQVKVERMGKGTTGKVPRTARTLSFFPESVKSYPYQLAVNPNADIRVILTNPRVGYVDVMGSRTSLMDVEDLVGFVSRNEEMGIL